MTESFGPYAGAALDVDLPPAAHGICGRPFDGVEVRHVDPDSGSEAVAGEPGEFQLRGTPNLPGTGVRTRSAVIQPQRRYHHSDLGSHAPELPPWLTGRASTRLKRP